MRRGVPVSKTRRPAGIPRRIGSTPRPTVGRACSPGGEQAAVIGHVSDQYPGKVILNTYLGGGRVLTKLTGAQLPRIC